MFRSGEKVLERERDIERVYYPNEPMTYPVVGTTMQGGGAAGNTIRYSGYPNVITNTTLNTAAGPNQQQQTQQMPAQFFATTQMQPGQAPMQLPQTTVNTYVGGGGGNTLPRGETNVIGRQSMRRNGGGGTLQRGDIAAANNNGDNVSECRSCSICSSERSVAEDAYRQKKKRRMLGKSFPLAALLIGLLICVSFINWIGIWSPFWALARNPFLIYPVTSTTTVNTGVRGVGGSGVGGAGDIPVLLNPQTVQPPGGRIGIGNPIFGHLGIWAYCAPRSFCVTYPYGRARPYGFFSAAAFSLSLAGLGGFFTQLFGGPLLGNLVGGLGFGGGLPGALGPGFAGLGGFGGTGVLVKKRSLRDDTMDDSNNAIFNSQNNFYSYKLPIHSQHKRDISSSSSDAFLRRSGRRQIQPQSHISAYGINPQAYQQPAFGMNTGVPRSLASVLPSNITHPFFFYDVKSPDGINPKLKDIVSFVKHYKEKLENPKNRGGTATGNANSSPTFQRAGNVNDLDGNRSVRRQMDSSPYNAGKDGSVKETDPDSSLSRNNRQLINQPLMDMGGGIGGGSLMNSGWGLGNLGLGGLGALGLGAFGNRFGGLNGLLGSQQALVAFALLQPGPEGIPLPENFLFSLPGSISPFAYFRNRVRENVAWFISVQTLVGVGFALNLLGFILGILYLCTYYSKAGRILGRLAGILIFLAAILELIGICVFIAKVRLDRNAFFHIDPAFTIHSGVGWAYYVSLSGALLLLILGLFMMWESSFENRA